MANVVQSTGLGMEPFWSYRYWILCYLLCAIKSIQLCVLKWNFLWGIHSAIDPFDFAAYSEPRVSQFGVKSNWAIALYAQNRDQHVKVWRKIKVRQVGKIGWREQVHERFQACRRFIIRGQEQLIEWKLLINFLNYYRTKRLIQYSSIHMPMYTCSILTPTLLNCPATILQVNISYKARHTSYWDI